MSDILRPELIWIERRCYRVNDPTTEIFALQEHDLYENENTFENLDDDDTECDNFRIIADGNRFYTTFHVAKHYIGSIIGKKGAMKTRIERDTRTNLKIPKQGEHGDIVIYGQSVASVKTACRRVNIIVMSSRMKQSPTHFISIPFNDVGIMKNFDNFKAQVLDKCKNKNIDESLFIKPQKLHLTIGVMCLMDSEERLLASRLLLEVKESILMPLLVNHLPFTIRLKGLSYMNDDPKNMNVLYGCVQEESGSGMLQTIADVIVDYFYKAGFMDRYEHGRENVKLHITLMNSKYTKKSTYEPFDGTDILRLFGDYDFGVINLTNIQLSQRNTTSHEGYYEPTFEISLNKI